MGGWYKDKWMDGCMDIVISDTLINQWVVGWRNRVIEEERD